MALKRHKKEDGLTVGGILRRKINILGVDVCDISQNLAVSNILNLSRDKRGKHIVVTVNSEFIMLAKKNPKFGQILKNADLSVADGVGVVIAKLIFGGKVNERVTGVDLIEKLCKESAKKAIRVGFLGGFRGVAQKLSERQQIKYPGLKIVLAQSGNPTIGQDLRLISNIGRVGRVDILFVAYGMGQQEFWIERNRKRLDIGVFIGVGGAFDYLSGTKLRAPKIVQNSGLEWLWRLVWEPKRVWRMRVLPLFFLLIIKELIGRLSSKSKDL